VISRWRADEDLDLIDPVSFPMNAASLQACVRLVLLCVLTGRARKVRRMRSREIGVIGPFLFSRIGLVFRDWDLYLWVNSPGYARPSCRVGFGAFVTGRL
jgi:hypothetical protein